MTSQSQREIIVRPFKTDNLVAPIQGDAGDLDKESEVEEGGVVQDGVADALGNEKVVDTDTRPVWEKMAEKMEDITVRVARHFEDENDQTKWKTPMIKAPQQPTEDEWMRHQLTHTPFAPWCKHCNSGRAVRANHQRCDKRAKLLPDTDKTINGSVKISMDYMYIRERVGQNKEDKQNPPYLVVVEHRYGRVWAYQTPNKGPHEEAGWLPARVIQDWNDCGFKDVRIQLKTDQEPSMVKLQTAIQDLRPKDIIPVNSPVGESESNGRVENAIRRVQEKTRVLRHQLEHNMKRRLPDISPIIAWMVRWAAELLSKYSCGDDGRSLHERLHGEKCATPLVPFGDTALYLPMKTVRRNKGDTAKRPGVWLGILTRTQEVLIGTRYGIIKCRAVTRMAESDRWNAEEIINVKGTPWEPVPGRTDRRVPVGIDERGNGVQPLVDEDEAQERPMSEGEEAPMQFRGGPDKFHVSKRAVERYGPTEGCLACTSMTKRGIASGRIGINHNDQCRKRITDAMKDDPHYHTLVKKHETGNNVDTVESDRTRLEEQRGNLKKSIHKMKQKMKETVNTITKQLEQTMLHTLIAQMDIAEFYSPPRITSMASRMGLRAGWSMDITTHDTDGRPWDFNNPEMRNRAATNEFNDKPMLRNGSPMCIVHSVINNINHCKMPAEVVKARFNYA